jgi:nitroimidazol reductase NimA-like FMN-containing flavoprotein (pyridoxamine 5'-phosphate oxidase superfamily)
MSRTKATRISTSVSDSDRAAFDALLDDSLIGHFAFVKDGGAMLLPIAIARDGDTVLLHGSTGSTWLRVIATGIPVTLEVTELDALVLARSAFESSMRYRSAVAFGACSVVSGDEKIRALDLITDHLIPGRVREVRRSTDRELAATLVLRFQVDEFSIKRSADWPEDSDADVAGQAWAGVVLAAKGYSAELPAPDLRTGIVLPASVSALLKQKDNLK